MLGDFMLEAPTTESTNRPRGILGYGFLGYVKTSANAKGATDLDGQCCSLPTALCLITHSYLTCAKEKAAVLNLLRSSIFSSLQLALWAAIRLAVLY